MALRYRDIAVKTAYVVLDSKELSPVHLGEEFNDGTFLTNKQLDKVQKYYDKIVARLKKQVLKIDDRAKGKGKGKKSTTKKATKAKTSAPKKTAKKTVKSAKKKGKKKGKK